MKFRSLLMLSVLALTLVLVPAVLADHQWQVTDVTCNPENQTITIYGISTHETSNDTMVYVNGEFLGYYYGADFTEGPVSFTVSDASFVHGAQIFVENPTTSTSASTVCGDAPEPVLTWFEPGDARINRQAYAPIAIYCGPAQLEVLAINGAGEGYPVISIPFSELPATPTSANVLIKSSGNVELYRLTTGEVLARVGPDAEGKYYRLEWNGCPYNTVEASTEQNGVVTSAEVAVF